MVPSASQMPAVVLLMPNRNTGAAAVPWYASSESPPDARLNEPERTAVPTVAAGVPSAAETRTTVPASVLAPAGAVQLTTPSVVRSDPAACQPLSVKWMTVPASTSFSSTKANASGVSERKDTMAASPAASTLAACATGVRTANEASSPSCSACAASVRRREKGVPKGWFKRMDSSPAMDGLLKLAHCGQPSVKALCQPCGTRACRHPHPRPISHP